MMSGLRLWEVVKFEIETKSPTCLVSSDAPPLLDIRQLRWAAVKRELQTMMIAVASRLFALDE